ncbi:MAG: universal stress protein [Ornithinimicrobium sp.]
MDTTSATSRPIVVGYDASDSAKVALTWAGQLAESTESEVTVLYAAQAIVYAQDVSYGLRTSQQQHEYATQIAEDGAKQIRAAHPSMKVAAMGSLLSASVALDEASTTASMIVVGSHGRGRFGAALLGSTAYAVSGHARCPVIVVREAKSPLPGPERPVVVGADGSVGADRAITAAADMAALWKAPLVVATAWTPPPPDPWDRPPFGYTSTEACLKAREHEATGSNVEALERVHAKHPDLMVEGVVREARPEDAVMEATAGAALLVLGSRGHGTLASVLLGSTARSVLHQTTMPVMVVH